MQTKSTYLSILLMIILALSLFAPNPALAAGTVTVKPTAMNGWGFVQEIATGTGSLVSGPGTVPLGSGSARFVLDATGREVFGTLAYAGTPLADITNLQYSTYRSSADAGNLLAVTLQFDMDYDLTDANTNWQGRLVFEPYFTAGSGNIPQNTWQTWTPLVGNWWMTGTPIVGNATVTSPCPQASPCSWAAILTAFPNAGLRASVGVLQFKAGGPWPGFDGNVDAFTIGINGDDTIYDFEPEPACTTVCYADAANGSDANGGASVGDAKKTIQAAIDAVNPGGEVRVLPGNYNETATNRFVLGSNGPHQFGLFIDKNGVTIQGVDAGDTPITNYNNVDAAYITTNATNNFGASGIFVQGDDVTLAGLHIGPNIPGDNKTIEIIGNGFTLKDSHVDVAGGGSVYFNDWQFDSGTNTSHVQSYTIDHNLIDQSTSIDFTSGAGYSGSVADRKIINNEFENADYWPSISFNGSGTGVPWFVQSVGGAVIQGNTFTNTFSGNDERAGHIRVRGTVDNSQFDWNSYWMDNTFNRAVVTLANVTTFDVREYTYLSGTYTFNTRRIGVNIQSGIDKAVAGDTVLVGSGVYTESPNINKSLTLRGAGRDVTTIQLQPGPTYLGALTIDGTNVTVHGFTILGFDGTPSTLASTNIYVTSTPTNVIISSNRIKVGAIDLTNSNGDDGYGLLTTYNIAADVDELNVNNNIFEPVNASGTRAFYINPGVNELLFYQNQITGKFDRTAITQAKHGFVDENTITGVGTAGNRSAGLGTWGYPDPAIYGHTSFRSNTITGVSKGIAVFATNNVQILNNFFDNNDVAIWVGDSSSLAFNPATILVHENSIVNSSLYGMQNTSVLTEAADGRVNWWGSMSGPSGVGPGTGNAVSSNVDFVPWLCEGTDTSAAIGFQPNASTLCSVATKLIFSTQPGNGVAGSPLSTQPVVKAVDQDGNLDPNFNSAVTLTINNNPGSGTLGGTTTANAINGVATFTNISIGQPGIGYTLDANGGQLTGATSAPFNVTAAGPAPAACLIYGVHDAGTVDSQFFTIDPATQVATNLGPLYKKWDFEALDIDPATGMIYATTSSGNAFNKRGYLYLVDGLNGSIFLVGSTGQRDIEALAFHPTTGALWGWANERGIVTINKATGAATVVKRLDKHVEAMAWNNAGTLLYLAEGKTLYSYNPVNGKLSTIAKDMPGKVEGMDMRPDGLLAIGVDGKTTLYAYNPVTKKFVTTSKISVPYNDIEGISWPVCAP